MSQINLCPLTGSSSLSGSCDSFHLARGLKSEPSKADRAPPPPPRHIHDPSLVTAFRGSLLPGLRSKDSFVVTVPPWK